MGRVLAYLGIAAVLILIVAIVYFRHNAPQPAVLPTNWPIPELTLPADATKYPARSGFVHEDENYLNLMTGVEYNGVPADIWTLSFQSAQSTQDVTTHVDRGLKTAGFLVLQEQGVIETGNGSCLRKMYSSEDGLYQVTLAYVVNEYTDPDYAYDGWTVEIVKLERPLKLWSPYDLLPID